MAKPTPSRKRKHTKDSQSENRLLRFDKINYALMGVGALVIIIGFALMAGGHQSGAEFNDAEIYSTRRIVIAPIVVILGFVIELVAILRVPTNLKKGVE